MRFAFGEYEFDPHARTLHRRGKRIPVQAKVVDLLAYLIEHRERVVSSEEILDTLWAGVSVTPTALSRAVQKARQAVGDDGERQAVLRTEHGRGFQFVAQVSVMPAADADPSSPIRSRASLAAAAGVAALLLAAVVVWLLNRSVEQPTAVQSIAVLPLENLSGDPEQEYFADGMTEALIGNLAKIRALRVISRTSSMHYKGTQMSLPEIAQELNVDAIIEGSVMRSEDRIRITTQLIDVTTDSHLWSDTFDSAPSDIFSVQDEITANVAEALKVALLGAGSIPIRQSPETSIEIYSDYLLARQKLTNPSYANFTEAVLLLKSVITRDSKYTPAYTSLAGAYWAMAGWGMHSTSEAAIRMKPIVEQARALDNQHAAVWYQLALVREEGGDLEGARAARVKALELDPRNPSALRSQIGQWLWTHEPERGLTYAAELLRVDPLSTASLFQIADMYRRLGRFDDAEKITAHMRSINPQITNHLTASWVLAANRGDLVRALGFLDELAKIEINDPEVPSSIARIYLALGDVAAAESLKDVARQLDPEAPWPRLMAALLYLFNDEDAKATAAARALTKPGSHNRHGIRGVALRIVLPADLADDNYEEIITRYLTLYPELADGIFPTRRLSAEYSFVPEAFSVTLDLASVYLHAGENAKAESLLSLIESELPHWPTGIVWGHGFANVELHALRGEREQALTALRRNVAMGMRYMWRWQLLHNPNLESIRDTSEFSAIVDEIEADMAAQLAQVHEMERSGELAAIPRGEASLH
jgi:TolB-like protein/Flp pilus assembly protein TadD